MINWLKEASYRYPDINIFNPDEEQQRITAYLEKIKKVKYIPDAQDDITSLNFYLIGLNRFNLQATSASKRIAPHLTIEVALPESTEKTMYSNLAEQESVERLRTQAVLDRLTQEVGTGAMNFSITALPPVATPMKINWYTNAGVTENEQGQFIGIYVSSSAESANPQTDYEIPATYIKAIKLNIKGNKQLTISSLGQTNPEKIAQIRDRVNYRSRR